MLSSINLPGGVQVRIFFMSPCFGCGLELAWSFSQTAKKTRERRVANAAVFRGGRPFGSGSPIIFRRRCDVVTHSLVDVRQGEQAVGESWVSRNSRYHSASKWAARLRTSDPHQAIKIPLRLVTLQRRPHLGVERIYLGQQAHQAKPPTGRRRVGRRIRVL